MTKRRAFKLLLFLLAGAIINVGVAWACHMCVDPPLSATSFRPGATVEVVHGFGLERRVVINVVDFGAMGVAMIRERSGWPLFTLTYEMDKSAFVVWPGFAINTIFYAAVLWVLFAAPFNVRRWRRIKRGQCASCGYSLRGTPDIDKCPECGATA